jgi:hypothetical protein
MTSRDYTEVYLRQYAIASRLLGKEYSPDALEELGPALIGRDELAARVDLRSALARRDANFASALAHAEVRWRREVKKEAVRCGVNRSTWWQSILRMAVEEPAAVRSTG